MTNLNSSNDTSSIIYSCGGLRPTRGEAGFPKDQALAIKPTKPKWQVEILVKVWWSLSVLLMDI